MSKLKNKYYALIKNIIKNDCGTRNFTLYTLPLSFSP